MNSTTTANDPNAVFESLRGELGQDAITSAAFLDNTRIYARPDSLIAALRILKERFGYALLSEL